MAFCDGHVEYAKQGAWDGRNRRSPVSVVQRQPASSRILGRQLKTGPSFREPHSSINRAVYAWMLDLKTKISLEKALGGACQRPVQ